MLVIEDMRARRNGLAEQCYYPIIIAALEDVASCSGQHHQRGAEALGVSRFAKLANKYLQSNSMCASAMAHTFNTPIPACHLKGTGVRSVTGQL